MCAIFYLEFKKKSERETMIILFFLISICESQFNESLIVLNQNRPLNCSSFIPIITNKIVQKTKSGPKVKASFSNPAYAINLGLPGFGNVGNAFQ